MGSIAVAVLPAAPSDDGAVTAMLQAAPHRGTTIETHACGQTVLGVGFDPRRRDGWVASDNGTAAAFVGSLDNQEDLNRELVRSGRSPGENPAQTVLAALRAWGDLAPARFRGSFAGAVSDGTGVRCFRDQLGLRTLYFRHERERFFAATEAKQVAAGAGIGRRADPDAVADIFFARFDNRATAVAGVERAPRGSVTSAGPGGIRFRRYWEPDQLVESARLTVDEACERFVELLEQAAARALTGEDAVSLSGGIDSPSVAAVAAPRHLARFGTALPALSAVYPDHPTVDEKRYVELVAGRLDMPLTTYVPEARPLDDVALWVDRLDGPVESVSVPEIAESYELARTLGAANVLTGELAEYVVSMRHHLLGHFLLHGRWSVARRWLHEERMRRPSWLAVARALAPSLASPLVARGYRALRPRGPSGVPPWVDAVQVPSGRGDLQRPARRRWAEAQLDAFRGAATTVEADEIVAAHCGVTVRRPFVDVDLWEFVLSLRAETKFPERLSKGFVRRAMRGRVPDEILDRRDKTGFEEHALAAADYEGIARWTQTEHRLEGIDYAVLGSRLEQRNMDVFELMWAYDLARAHAFLSVAA
jgi:asparagine synthase (glutamine-hydrolysing)